MWWIMLIVLVSLPALACALVWLGGRVFDLWSKRQDVFNKEDR